MTDRKAQTRNACKAALSLEARRKRNRTLSLVKRPRDLSVIDFWLYRYKPVGGGTWSYA